jgi:uncharacterized alpha-E superfamily protein
VLDKGITENLTWRPLLEIFTNSTEEEIESLENNTNEVLKKVILDVDNTNSLKTLINRARENARGVQDHITKEVWENVNQMYHMVNNPTIAAQLLSEDSMEVIDLLTKQSVLYAGVTDITMPRGIGWNFMNLGKYIERCLETLEITDREFKTINYDMADQQDILYWRVLLLSISGYELHLKTYRDSNGNKSVLQQAIMNANFTRSVIYSLTRIHRYLEDLVKGNESAENQALIRCFGRLYSHVKFIDFDTLDTVILQEFLEKVKTELLDFSWRFGQSFFSYS